MTKLDIKPPQIKSVAHHLMHTKPFKKWTISYTLVEGKLFFWHRILQTLRRYCCEYPRTLGSNYERPDLWVSIMLPVLLLYLHPIKVFHRIQKEFTQMRICKLLFFPLWKKTPSPLPPINMAFPLHVHHGNTCIPFPSTFRAETTCFCKQTLQWNTHKPTLSKKCLIANILQ